MNPQELESLLNDILSGIQEALQAGEILPEELQNQLADEIESITSQLDQLYSEQSQQPPGEPPQEPGTVEIPIDDETRLLWILSGGQPNDFVNYLRTYPDVRFQQLLRDPNRLQETVMQLQRVNPIGEVTQAAQGIPKSQLQSSNIYGTRYDEKTGKLKVRFNSGSIYEYDNVPAYVFNAFKNGASTARTNGKNQYGQWWRGKNPSMGAAFHDYIRQAGYNYRRLR